MKSAIDQINLLLAEKTLADLVGQPALRAAFERFLEIISEASRHVPDRLKADFVDIEWRRIADLGNPIGERACRRR